MAITTRSPNHFPSQLATPTDLPDEAVQAISDAVNPLIADAFALYVRVLDVHNGASNGIRGLLWQMQR